MQNRLYNLFGLIEASGESGPSSLYSFDIPAYVIKIEVGIDD
jgi:hypothetical protein